MNREVKQTSQPKRKERTAILPQKWKPRRWLALDKYLHVLRICTTHRHTHTMRANAINHASVALQQFFTGGMQMMHCFIFAWGGGLYGLFCLPLNKKKRKKRLANFAVAYVATFQIHGCKQMLQLKNASLWTCPCGKLWTKDTSGSWLRTARIIGNTTACRCSRFRFFGYFWFFCLIFPYQTASTCTRAHTIFYTGSIKYIWFFVFEKEMK